MKSVKMFCFAKLCGVAHLLVLLALLATTARADREGDFTFYSTDGATAVLTSFLGSGAMVIPDRLGNLPVTSVESYAFAYRTNLTSVTIPNSMIDIRQGAFIGCTGLASVIIPDSVISIGNVAFAVCTALKSITIPDSVTSIGFDAFYGCTGLTSVTIPDSVTGIGDAAFSDCTGLGAIEVDPLNLSYSSVSGVLFNKTQSLLVQYPAGKAGPYAISNSVTNIGPFAFSGCKGLTSVTIPDSVTLIGPYSFYRCTGLTNVAIPDSVTDIGPSAFSGCTGLRSVTIPGSVTSIVYKAFSSCTGLTSVYFEGNAPATGGQVFIASAFVTVFYRAGTTGWGSTFSGQPTAVWLTRPAYSDWTVTTGLTAQFPNASAESDDPDGDGVTNADEWFTGTDPTQHASHLEMELTPRPADLSDSDQTPVEPGQHAVYFRSVPGHYYGVQRATSLGGAWELQATKVAATIQTRFVVSKSGPNAFYRVVALP